MSFAFKYRLTDFLFTLAAVAVTTAALTLLRARLSTQVIALLYLLPVMLSAVRWRLLPALVASLAAFFAFNYFFLAPTHTLTVRDPEELLALVVFLIVAVLISQSVGAANLHAAQARAREVEATTLYNLSRALSAQAGLDETLSSVTRLVTEAFDLAGCEILWAAAESHPSPAYYAATGDCRIEHGPVVEIPLTAQQGTVGALRLVTRQPESPVEPTTTQLLTSFAAQLGLFIERARLAREADRARLLEESDRLKSALLSSVSHDLRTPLSAIKASATVLLQEDVALDAAARHDLLSAINEETDRLNRLVGDLLDMSRIEAGALQLRRDWCDLDELIRAVAHRLSPRTTAFQVQLDLADLPLVYADYVQIDRVVTNLLENAIHFAPPGSAIHVTARAEAEAMTVAVTNQGPAIPERMRPHLFDKFYRISEDRAPDMGTGLGLSICKGIVEAHGGRIWAQSPVAENAGARFVFTLPFPSAGQAAHLSSKLLSDEKDQNPDR